MKSCGRWLRPHERNTDAKASLERAVLNLAGTREVEAESAGAVTAASATADKLEAAPLRRMQQQADR